MNNEDHDPNLLGLTDNETNYKSDELFNQTLTDMSNDLHHLPSSDNPCGGVENKKSPSFPFNQSSSPSAVIPQSLTFVPGISQRTTSLPVDSMVSTTNCLTRAKSSRDTSGRSAEGFELDLVYSKLTRKGVYKRPVLVSLLAMIAKPPQKSQKQPTATKSSTLDSIETSEQEEEGDQIIVQSLAPRRLKKLRGFVLKVHDVIESREARLVINLGEYNRMQAELMALHDSIEVVQYFEPESPEWWSKYLMYLVLVFDRPSGELAVVVDRKRICRMVAKKMEYHKWMNQSMENMSNANSINNTNTNNEGANDEEKHVSNLDETINQPEGSSSNLDEMKQQEVPVSFEESVIDPSPSPPMLSPSYQEAVLESSDEKIDSSFDQSGHVWSSDDMPREEAEAIESFLPVAAPMQRSETAAATNVKSRQTSRRKKREAKPKASPKLIASPPTSSTAQNPSLPSLTISTATKKPGMLVLSSASASKEHENRSKLLAAAYTTNSIFKHFRYLERVHADEVDDYRRKTFKSFAKERSNRHSKPSRTMTKLSHSLDWSHQHTSFTESELDEEKVPPAATSPQLPINTSPTAAPTQPLSYFSSSSLSRKTSSFSIHSAEIAGESYPSHGARPITPFDEMTSQVTGPAKIAAEVIRQARVKTSSSDDYQGRRLSRSELGLLLSPYAMPVMLYPEAVESSIRSSMSLAHKHVDAEC